MSNTKVQVVNSRTALACVIFFSIGMFIGIPWGFYMGWDKGHMAGISATETKIATKHINPSEQQTIRPLKGGRLVHFGNEEDSPWAEFVLDSDSINVYIRDKDNKDIHDQINEIPELYIRVVTDIGFLIDDLRFMLLRGKESFGTTNEDVIWLLNSKPPNLNTYVELRVLVGKKKYVGIIRKE